MKDDKIEEAAEKYARKYKEYPVCTDEACKDGFNAGINWFKENLWHDISECNDEEFDLYTFVLGMDGVGFFDIVSGKELKMEQEDYVKWLYLDDLMKGGK